MFSKIFLRKSDIEICGFGDIIFAVNARSAYRLQSKYHAQKVHIIRRKANITENDRFQQESVVFCLWATKKIFWAVFRMNSNSYITVSF